MMRGDKQGGIRPKSIRVQLYANDQKSRQVELSAENKLDPYAADLDEKANGNTIALIQ